MSKPIVYIVHGIDVEGPMTETIDATFERMRSYGLPRKVEATNHNLELIQGKNLDFLVQKYNLEKGRLFTFDKLGTETDSKPISDLPKNLIKEILNMKRN